MLFITVPHATPLSAVEMLYLRLKISFVRINNTDLIVHQATKFWLYSSYFYLLLVKFKMFSETVHQKYRYATQQTLTIYAYLSFSNFHSSEHYRDLVSMYFYKQSGCQFIWMTIPGCPYNETKLSTMRLECRLWVHKSVTIRPYPNHFNIVTCSAMCCVLHLGIWLIYFISMNLI